MDQLKTGASTQDVLNFVKRHPRGSSEFMHAALRGVIPGVRRVTFGGFNPDVDTATVPEAVWGGDGLIPRPESAEAWEIVSASPNDTAAGTGARTLTITTLDANYAEIVQTVTLNGLTPVALTGTHRFINAATVLTAGSGFFPAGTLAIRVAGAGAARGYVSTDGVLNQAKYTVPDGYVLDMHNVYMGLRTTGAAESAVLSFNVTNAAGRTLSVIRFPLGSNGVSAYRHEVDGGRVPFNRLAARTEFSVRVTLVTQNNVACDVNALGLLYQLALWP